MFYVFIFRLDRLFVLLETGSTPATRKAAAQQLGQVQRLHPHELPQLLSRVQKCLRSTSWETRVAAGQAVEAIVSQLPQWNPPGIDIKTEERSSVIVKVEQDGATSETSSPVLQSTQALQLQQARRCRLTFDTFNVDRLLSKDAQFLMASEARVFENTDQVSTGTGDDAARQRNLINKRLGLDIAEKIGIDTSDIVTNEDLIIDDGLCSNSSEDQPNSLSTSQSSTTGFGGVYPPPLLRRSDSGMWESDEPMSSRELNLAKRRARKQKSREAASCDNQSGDGSMSPSCGTNGNKKFKREDSVSYETNGDSGSAFTVAEGMWPLSGWVDVLINDLFSPCWEIRHGAATALREVIKLHGKCGGKEANLLSTEVLNKCD